MKLVDTHTHIDFYDNIDKILRGMRDKDIEAVFVTHLPELFERYQVQISKYTNIYLALGYHPILIKEYDFNKKLFLKLKNHTKFIGEIGLDYSITSSQVLREKQRDAFSFICRSIDNQILSIHSRFAEDDVLQILKDCNVRKAIFHWYTGSENYISEIIDRGYFFSANHTMLRSNKGINILRQIPLDRLLIETDGPFTKYGAHIVSFENLHCIYKDFSQFYHQDNLAQIVWGNYLSLVK